LGVYDSPYTVTRKVVGGVFVRFSCAASACLPWMNLTLVMTPTEFWIYQMSVDHVIGAQQQSLVLVKPTFFLIIVWSILVLLVRCDRTFSSEIQPSFQIGNGCVK
jgi:hypothetical protein